MGTPVVVIETGRQSMRLVIVMKGGSHDDGVQDPAWVLGSQDAERTLKGHLDELDHAKEP